MRKKQPEQGFFITGTNTGVGKTFIACAILSALDKLGYATRAIKPILSGAEQTPMGLQGEDGLLLQQYVNQSMSYSQVNPITLQHAIAPHLAARLENVPLSLEHVIQASAASVEMSGDVLIIEGAGGWRVPIDETHFLSHYCSYLGYPAILVVDIQLGCINHAVLTSEVIREDGVYLAGWVANFTSPPDSVAAENITTLSHLLQAPCLGVVEYHQPTSIVNATNAVMEGISQIVKEKKAMSTLLTVGGGIHS